MRRIATHILIILGVLFAQGKYTVDEISIHSTKDSTFVLVITSGPAEFKKFSVDNPARLGIDLFGGIFNLPKSKFSIERPGIIMSVRGSQNKPAPNAVTRIVLDLVEKVSNANIRSHPEGVMIAIPTPGYPEFKKWSTGRLAAGKGAKIPAETTAVAETVAAKPETTAAPAGTTKTAAIEGEEIPPELAMYMRPETLTYKGITADKETIEVAKYIRNMVVYIPTGIDPFITPKSTKEVPLGAQPVPLVDQLSVVGIVQSGNLKMALLQDNSGFNYIMSPGDTVDGGYCSEVTDSSAKFSLFEFGQMRKVELPLIKPEKGKSSP